MQLSRAGKLAVAEASLKEASGAAADTRKKDDLQRRFEMAVRAVVGTVRLAIQQPGRQTGTASEQRRQGDDTQ